MLRRLTLTVPLLVLAWPASSLAQDQEAPDMDTVVMNYWKCDYGAMEELIQKARDFWIPAAQELQDEGTLAYAQVMTHAWGDEWNLVFYFRSADLPAYLEAWEAWLAKLDERDPTGSEWFFARCKEHKDNIYSSVAQTAVP